MDGFHYCSSFLTASAKVDSDVEMTYRLAFFTELRLLSESRMPAAILEAPEIAFSRMDNEFSFFVVFMLNRTFPAAI